MRFIDRRRTNGRSHAMPPLDVGPVLEPHSACAECYFFLNFWLQSCVIPNDDVVSVSSERESAIPHLNFLYCMIRNEIKMLALRNE